ncbi:hypothetical protein N7451_012099 [Penicillium sp. IBT 35674x]|nr:hypothetical protein N7451_012099 [Penicillium sp. IBT 35674x]
MEDPEGPVKHRMAPRATITPPGYSLDSEKAEDPKIADEFSGWKLAWLTYQSLGVIYGDVGTSPLYVYSSTFSSEPSKANILGAVSLVIWALTIMVTIKYVFIVLRADDEGEGGTFALYSLRSRYAKLVRYDPRQSDLVRMQRYNTEDLQKPNLMTRSIMERSTFIKWTLKVVGAFGVALILADGVLTPAQSILGAIQEYEIEI